MAALGWSDGWWDGQCGSDASTADKFAILKQYNRPLRDSRMSGSQARMYCGKALSTQSESKFGLRHIRDKHKSKFAEMSQRESQLGTRDWGHFMHIAIMKTLSDPRKAYKQSEKRYCYQRTFYLTKLNDPRSLDERDVVVILGRTGTRIMTAFPSSNKFYCSGVVI